MQKIKLKGGLCAMVDNEDYPYLSRFSWHMSSEKHGRPITYFTGQDGKAKGISMSRFLMTKPSRLRLIYKNKNTLDNRKENIVAVSVELMVHLAEKRKGLSSEYKGVCYHKKREKWIANIDIKGKKVHIGSFNNETDAALAFNVKARDVFGDMAYQNKI